MVDGGEAIQMTWPNKTTCRRDREGHTHTEREREVEATEWRDRDVAVHRSSPRQSQSLSRK